MSMIAPNPPRWQPSTDPSSIVVPGLDGNASFNDQIDQIEQLITIKLQNIDANFSKIQNVMATRLLPSVKRYAVSTEPVREAAKFWTSFYEKTAQVHIPTYEDHSSLHEQPSGTTSQAERSLPVQPDREATPQYDEEGFTVSSVQTGGETTAQFNDEDFAESSTPARTHNADDQPSWNPSLELSSTSDYSPAPEMRSRVGLGLMLPLGLTPRKDLLPALGRTPGREAAERIRRDLLGDVQSEHSSVRSSATIDRFGGFKKFGYSIPEVTEDTMSTIPTPPSITRYTRHAYPSAYENTDSSASFANMMRRAGLSAPESISKSHSTTSHQSSDTPQLTPSHPQTLYTPDQHSDSFHFQHEEPSTIQPGGSRLDSDSDSDSLGDESVHIGLPSTAFLMASARNQDPDDSFGSSNSNHSSDSIGEDFSGEGGAVHPFARAVENEVEGDGFDDSFDSADGDGLEVQEETVFGIPPAQRHHGRGPNELRLLGEDLLQDTIGIGSQLAKVGRVEESPTPYGRG